MVGKGLIMSTEYDKGASYKLHYPSTLPPMTVFGMRLVYAILLPCVWPHAQ